MPAGGGWQDVVGTELATAVAQNADAAARGFTLILKKNGRVGTRRLGMPSWDGLVQDVDARRAGGLDTANIYTRMLSRFCYWHVFSTLFLRRREAHHQSGAVFNRSVAVGERGRVSGAAASSGTSTVANGEPSTWRAPGAQPAATSTSAVAEGSVVQAASSHEGRRRYRHSWRPPSRWRSTIDAPRTAP